MIQGFVTTAPCGKVTEDVLTSASTELWDILSQDWDVSFSCQTLSVKDFA